MTSECDAKKTNEFLRRRKLRLLQVREQSKEIAKKIRQRTKVEKIRQLESIDEKLKKEYLEHQNNFIRKLEQYYADGVSSVGTGHKNASNVNLQDIQEKPDPSVQRGRQAIAELKRKKQALLDEKKKQLDRKLQAREIANEISKEKSASFINKLISKATQATAEDRANNPVNDIPIKKVQSTETDKTEKPEVVTSDMATQWDLNEMPKEWEPNVPNLLLQGNDEEQNSLHLQESSSDKPIKKMNLFAVSDEMPSSLRGRLPCVPEEPASSKSSLTLVSEYLRNRDLRLRESSTVVSSKPSQEDLQSVKATLLKTRASRQEVTESKESPFNNNDNSFKRSSVKMYNHSTRDVRDVPHDDVFVSRYHHSNEDAFSQAVKQSTTSNRKEKEHQKRLSEMRSKLAVTRQTVEKEYKDTMDFLGTISKGKSKPIRNAHLDEHRQQIQRQNRQRKLQQEYTQIEKGCRRHHHHSSRNNNNLSHNSDDEFALKDFQYSWMPVPDSDSSLAIHTIPTTFRPTKSGNSVKFNKVDSYHEYRSRHKHTPPTKEVTNDDLMQRGKKVLKGTDEDDSESVDEDTSESSDTSSAEHQPARKNKSKRKCKKDKVDIEKLLVYKILQSKMEKKGKGKGHAKLLKNLVKSLSSEEKNSIIKAVCTSEDESEKEGGSKSSEPKVTFEQLKEGVYKAVGEEGRENVASIHPNNSSRESNSNSPPGNNIGRENPDKTMEACSTYSSNESQNKSTKNETKKKKSRSQNFGSECDFASNTTQTSADKGVSVTKPAVVTQISQIPSTSSFQSAVTNTQANIAKNGLIKMLDEDVAEPGKFYVGATGFIQDNDYEVVIKLRKKNAKDDKQEATTADKSGSAEPIKHGDSKKEDIEICQQIKSGLPQIKDAEGIRKTDSELTSRGETGSIRKTNSEYLEKDKSEYLEPIEPDNVSRQDNNSEYEQQKKLESIEVELSEKLRNTFSNIKESANNALIALESENYERNDNVKSSVKKIGNEEGFSLDNKAPTKSVQEKSVSTSPIPLSVTNQHFRNANTISTQTTLESIDHEKPALHHMSSTSTAYMSPPNYVLPVYFKNKGVQSSHKERFDQNGNLQNKETNSKNLKEGYGVYRSCKSKPCRYDKNKICNTSRSSSPNPISNGEDYIENRCSPEYDSGSVIRVILNNAHKKKKHIHTKMNCSRHSIRSCESLRLHSHRLDIPETIKKIRKCKKLSQSSKIRSSKASLVLRPGSNKATSLKRNNNMNKSSKVSLSPIIKSYIDHLLDLNKESIKALAVMNQDCSSVTTPGSSIVDEPHNINLRKTSTHNICLQKIKDLLKQQILEQINIKSNKYSVEVEKHIRKSVRRYTDPKSCHKVKSINISKHLLTPKKRSPNTITVDSSDVGALYTDEKVTEAVLRSQTKHGDSESCKIFDNQVISPEENSFLQSSEMTNSEKEKEKETGTRDTALFDKKQVPVAQKNKNSENFTADNSCFVQNSGSFSAGTQTCKLIDNEVNFMKLAEHKLQNMEKIANLTEKCTKRLSNLAKVLEEVRRNKLTYNQMSDSSSESDRKSEKLKLSARSDNRPLTPNFDGLVVHKNNGYTKHNEAENNKQAEPILLDQESVTKNSKLRNDSCINRNIEQPVYHVDTSDGNAYNTNEKQKSPEARVEYVDPFLISDQAIVGKETGNVNTYLKSCNINSASGSQHSVEIEESDSLGCIAFLKDIPKPDNSKNKTNNTEAFTETEPYQIIKNKNRPPPALSRINLKSDQDYIVPHELSTVIEIDSPLSVKLKNQSHAVNTSSHHKTEFVENEVQGKDISVTTDANPDLVQTPNQQDKTSAKDVSDDSKIKMMDLKQFNEIMLKPFISLQEYVKQCNVETLDDGCNVDDVPKEGPVTEDVSSLQSDGSLPDVIAELLKRNIINEPFKFDVASNINSTTLSSESTLSVLALSKMQRSKKKVSKILKNKENIAESSDSLSISSNPDLENAFKQLGMGWASSTLKKTKERLALSSSSNTSSTSFSQFRVKKKDNAVLGSNSSAIDDSKKLKVSSSFRNVEQQTSKINAMTVKEFLTNELAKKMTFTNKSHKKDVSDEFVSLYETKNPDETKQVLQDRTVDSGCSGSNNRVRTSTPVQIFKSNVYHSSTSSNQSNGLFSNVDDLSSVKVTSTSPKQNSTSEKDDLTIPNYSLRMKKGSSDYSPSD